MLVLANQTVEAEQSRLDYPLDRIVLATLPVDSSAWLRFDVVERARATYEVPVTHVIAHSLVPAR